MLENYFKTAWRNLAKNKIFSFINIIGLAVGLACSLTIGLFVFDELSFDKFHQNGGNIFRVIGKQSQPDAEYKFATTPGPLAPTLKDEYPEVVDFCRIRKFDPRTVKSGTSHFESISIFSTDNSFFRMFDFELLTGDKNTALTGPDDLIVSQKMAEKLFGKDWQSKELIGKALEISGTQNQTYKIVGFAKNAPQNSHIQFDFLASVAGDLNNQREYKWNGNGYHTYIQLSDNKLDKSFSAKIENLLPKYVNGAKTKFYLQPFDDIYLKSKFDFNTDWAKTSDILYTKIFSIVALVLLVIAIFNFIKLSTAKAVKRAAEVGVRKTIGASSGQLLTQFLGEAALVSGISLLLSLGMLAFTLPLMNQIAGKQIAYPTPGLSTVTLITGFWVLLSIMAGIFPAIYLSKIQPIKALKNVLSGENQWWRKTFVTAQFAASIVLIIGAITIHKQLNYIQSKNLGFDQNQLVSIDLPEDLRKNTNSLIHELQQNTTIEKVAPGSNSLIDINNGTSSLQWEGKQGEEDKFLMTVGNINPDYFATTGMQVLAGRNFDAKMGTDTTSAFIINEAACKRMGWTKDEALGKQLTLWEQTGQIIGVVQDFHFHKLNTEIGPFLFRSFPQEGYKTLMVKIKPNQISESLAFIKSALKKHSEGTFKYQFVDEALNTQYDAEQRIGKIVFYFTLLVIFVSCLGLFGLSIFTAEQKVKEIGVRKILGASVVNIVSLLSKDLVILIMAAFLIATPIGYYFLSNWLQEFAYRTDISWWIFAVAGFGALIISLLTVSLQAIKAALTNPVKSLRTE